MAIYSLNVRSIGKTTHASGTAGAHARYIARPGAEAEIVAVNMPADPNEARAWLDAQEAADRKNARVADKVRIAIPRELNEEQRLQLVQDFCQDVTGGRVPYYAAIHQDGADAHNPHAHIIVRDRDIETGKRVLKWSDSKRDREKAGLAPNAVDHIRERWEMKANEALKRAGHDARIDRRSLIAQGVDREPTIHIGPNAKKIESEVHRPVSQDRDETRWWRDYRETTPYEFIDAGRTRSERNAEIIDFNLEKASRSPDFPTRERAKLQKELAHKERVLERQLVAAARQRTHELRHIQAQTRTQLDQSRQDARAEEAHTRRHLAEKWRASRAALKEQQDRERAALSQEQSRFKARFMRVVDLTGRTRARQDADRKALQASQSAERSQMVETYRDHKNGLLEAVRARHDDIQRTIKDAGQQAHRAIEDRHIPAENEAEAQRQRHEAERARLEEFLENRLQIEKRMNAVQERNRHHGPRTL